MNIWLIIWVLLALALIGFSVWTYLILYQQKQAWRAFAKAHKLRYRNHAFMQSPEVNGLYQDYPIGIFTSEHDVGSNTGTTRKLTALEVELKTHMPIAGALGSGGMVPIIQGLPHSDELRPDHPDWSSDNIIRCEDRKIIEGYLTEERLKALISLINKKHSWLIFIFKGQDMILRIDTSDPLESVEKLTKVVDDLVNVALLLELEKGEENRLEALKSKRKEQTQNKVEVDESDMDSSHLQFDDNDDDEEGGQDRGQKKSEASSSEPASDS